MKRIFSINEVAKVLNVNRNTIRDEIKNGKLNALRIGNQFRITLIDLNEYLKTKERTDLLFDQDEERKKPGRVKTN